ncbi:MAG: class I SAM-dependent DNA methyltransferase, partial [Gemmataceae bacterium]
MPTSVLGAVGLDPTSGDTLEGLVSVRRPPVKLRVDEAALVRTAQAFDAVDYIFFRRFDDTRSSQPAAFVIDNTAERLSEGQLAKSHHDLWLLGVVPLIYIAWPTRIDVLSCARGPDFWNDGQRRYGPAEQLEVASRVDAALAARQRFSARRLADGTFWEEPANQALAHHEQAAHQSLIQAVVETDQELEGETNPVLRRLLLLTVLVKYLEDRGVFPGEGWFGRFRKGARSFLDVLQGGEPDEVSKLLETLEKKFNGDVFRLPENTRLTKNALRSFARLVEARTLGEQRYLWELYSFDHLPVDIISHLYQRFVRGSTAVYTPPFLAALLLDVAMPYDKLTGRERTLDPACGSGVFLVGAFRRLVNVWRARHQWRTPNVDTLKSILRNQIFGVELSREAVDLTAFSLALAVCDSLQPNVIWSELRFDPLRDHNLWQADFFEACEPGHAASSCLLDREFDLIVGNPPFESKFTEPAQRSNARRVAERGKIPDKQIAYLFLDRCLEMLTETGRLCLIQPSSFLYNLQSHGFRSFVARTGRVESVLDFTSIRGLYAGADPKTVAVLVGGDKTSRFTHLTFRRTFRTAERIGFELDHYDRHHLSVDEVARDAKAARANLLGGGRLAAIAAKLRQVRTLAQYVEERGWLMAEGFIEGRSGKQPGEHITGSPYLPTSALTASGIDRESIGVVKATHFGRSRSAQLFAPPLGLIRENELLPMAYWDEGPLAYKHEIVGIHAPTADRDKVRQVFDDL